MKKELKIPSILGLLFLVVTVVGGVYLTSRPAIYTSNASSECSPYNTQVTNLTHKSAVVSFFTNSACIASLQIGGRTYSDSRSMSVSSSDHASKTHYFQIDGLKESTEYQYSLIVGGKTYTSSKQTLTTNKTPGDSIPSSQLAWGQVITANGNPAVNAIVYLNISGGQPLSSHVTSNGNWTIPLSASFNESGSGWFSVPVDTLEDIVVISEDGVTTQVTGSTNSNNPVPNIIIGQNSFLTPTAIPQGNRSISMTSHNINLKIINPKNGETISTGNPDVFGSGAPGSVVLLGLAPRGGEQTSVSVDSSGVWHWSPTSSLADGEYVITVTQSGSTESVRFSVASLGAGDSSLAFTASASATRSPTATPIVEPTNTPIPTPTPTDIVRTVVPSTASGTPVSGGGSYTVIMIVLAIVVIAFSGYGYILRKN